MEEKILDLKLQPVLQQLKKQDELLEKIFEQTRATNGRVTKLEVEHKTNACQSELVMQLREDVFKLKEKNLQNQKTLDELEIQTELTRFFSKHPKLFRFVVFGYIAITSGSVFFIIGREILRYYLKS